MHNYGQRLIIDRYAPLVALSHHPQALFWYDVVWVVLLVLAVPFAWSLYRSAKDIDRRMRWMTSVYGDCDLREDRVGTRVGESEVQDADQAPTRLDL